MANLVVQTAFLGDLLLAIPLIKGLKRISPEPVELVCRKGAGEILLVGGLVDAIHEIDKKDFKTLDRVGAALRQREFNFVLSPHQSLRTALFVRGLKARRKIAFKTWWNFWAFDSRVERPMHLPDALRQLSLLQALDPKIGDLLTDVQTRLHNRAPLFTPADLSEIPEWASMRLSSFGREGQLRERRVFLAPGSQWATKRWTEDGFVTVGADFSKRGFEIVLVGSQPENEICERIAGRLPGSVNLCGKTSLKELAEILAAGALLVVNDSGLMHLGAVSGIPTVAIFGPTTLELGYRPWQSRALVVESDLGCRPCGKHGHQKCPLGHHACMKQITPEEVVRTAQQLIATV